MDFLHPNDRLIKKAWDEVYRRDRIGNKGKCVAPSNSQLNEMLTILEKNGIVFEDDKEQELIESLLRIADIFRKREIERRTKNICNTIGLDNNGNEDVKGGLHDIIADLNESNKNDSETIETVEICDYIKVTTIKILKKAIKMAIDNKIENLKNSRKYSIFSDKYAQMLYKFYEENMTIKEITQIYQLKTWDKCRRILNINELICDIKVITDHKILQELNNDSRFDISNVEIVKKVIEEIKNYTDELIFKEARANIKTGRNISRNTGIFGEMLIAELKTGVVSVVRS